MRVLTAVSPAPGALLTRTAGAGKVADDAPIRAATGRRGRHRAGQVYARADTPVHLVLHEAGHIICMDAARRARLGHDAAASTPKKTRFLLQIVLAGNWRLTSAICADMDAWATPFRLGRSQPGSNAPETRRVAGAARAAHRVRRADVSAAAA